MFSPKLSGKTRGFIKVQDGCNGFCAYCQIPYARGSSISVPEDDILKAVENYIENEVKEIVLTGIHIGDYGDDLKQEKKSNLAQLIDKISSYEKIKRIRISSLEPSELSNELLETLARKKSVLCHHFHLPLQSGSDDILRSMGRQYTTQEYFETVHSLRTIFPDSMISADIIPGFPGESEKNFQESIDFIKKCQLDSLHVFPYSKRPNTRALRYSGHLETEQIKERASILRTLSSKLEKDFYSKFIGKEKNVLWEKYNPKLERYVGKTENYIPLVSAKTDQNLTGLIETISIAGFYDHKHLLAINTNKKKLVKIK